MPYIQETFEKNGHRELSRYVTESIADWLNRIVDENTDVDFFQVTETETSLIAIAFVKPKREWEPSIRKQI